MIRSLITILVICNLTIAVPSQQRGSRRRRVARASNNVRLVREQPTVFISFERVGRLAPESEGLSGERIWLRLQNNTRWSIVLHASDWGDEAYGDALMYYDVQEVPRPQI